MKTTASKQDFLSTVPGILTAAIAANLLWGSAAPCIKLGYQYFAIAESDTMSQILFAGVRFTLAGILTILIGSLLRGRFLLPKRGSGGMILTLAMMQTVIQYTFFYIGLSQGLAADAVSGPSLRRCVYLVVPAAAAAPGFTHHGFLFPESGVRRGPVGAAAGGRKDPGYPALCSGNGIGLPRRLDRKHSGKHRKT